MKRKHSLSIRAKSVSLQNLNSVSATQQRNVLALIKTGIKKKITNTDFKVLNVSISLVGNNVFQEQLVPLTFCKAKIK